MSQPKAKQQALQTKDAFLSHGGGCASACAGQRASAANAEQPERLQGEAVIATSSWANVL